MEEENTSDSAETYKQPHHTLNPNTASEPIVTLTLSRTLTPTEFPLQSTPAAATRTPQVRAPYNAPTATFYSMTNPSGLKKTLHQSYAQTSTRNTQAHMNNLHLQTYFSKHYSPNFHWRPSKKRVYAAGRKNPHIMPTQLTHECIKYTIEATKHKLQIHCKATKWTGNDFGSGGANKYFLFCISKIIFGDHTKEAETRAILTQYALENVDTFKSFVPILHLSPLPHLLAARPT
jgi:hypothetical protein